MTTGLYPAFGVLLVDDEPAWLRSLGLTLERHAGLSRIETCQDSRQVLAILETGRIGLAVLDLNMPHLSGEELLQAIAERHPEVAVIVTSGMNQVDTAVRCMRLGAVDYFVKTAEEDRLVGGVLRAVRMLELQREHREVTDRLLSGAPANAEAFGGFLTQDRTMQTILAYLEAVAPSPHPLLVEGESGVGKELIARAAHALGRRKGPLVAVNVAGLDDAVFADTLFGHAKGAYTGADQARAGMIEEAADGTLFLDEIGDLAKASQVKLLRLLQEGEYFPLGSDRAKKLRARVVVATHQDLAARQQTGEFRRDLYFRLCTHRVQIPPLRQRKDDIPLLLEHFLGEAARALGKKKPTAPRELPVLLSTYAFPGNVRELKAMAADAVSQHKSRVLSMESFLKAMGRGASASALPATGPGGPGGPGSEDDGPPKNPFAGWEQLPTFREAADLLVDEALARAQGSQTQAARLLGISQPALSKRLRGRSQGEGA